jgi:copper resistance protein B
MAALFAASSPAVAQQAAASSADAMSMGSSAMPMAPTAGDRACPPEHAAMGHCKPSTAADPPHAGPPAAALTGPDNAADAVWGADVMEPVRRAVYAENGSMVTGAIMIDRLEYHAQKGRSGYSWEGEGWYGGDYDRLWVKSRGEGDLGGSLNSAEVQGLWSHAIDPWFNLQAGLRYDLRPRPGRAQLALGVKGLVPYMLDIDATAFLSKRGDLSARIEAEYDQRITNSLILQPRAEINLAAQDRRSIHQGSGLTSIETGLRLRYQFVPEFAPYLGVEYERDLGRTARFSRAAGDRLGGWRAVFGVSAWF